MVPRRPLGFWLAALALLVGPAPTALGRPAAPPDSTEVLSWARALIHTRQAVAAAEHARTPDRQAALADVAFLAARSLAAHPAHHADASTHDLVVRAQALYEAHHGTVAPLPLSPAEFASLRGSALAALREPDYVPTVEDPAAAATRRVLTVEVARRDAAEDARAGGPAHLFYPADADALVARQRGVARRFAGLRGRMRRHFPQVERALRRRGLPLDLKYVALVESGLDPSAESHAGARGLWQFMPETAADYGLDSLTVVDPAASTDAAARYLRWLGRRFDGDWQLALAAYNCGVGRVEEAVRQHRRVAGGAPTFWDIYAELPRETQEYVPRFIAVAELLGGAARVRGVTAPPSPAGRRARRRGHRAPRCRRLEQGAPRRSRCASRPPATCGY